MRIHEEYPGDGGHTDIGDLRCRCGRLMARVIRHAIEMKCPRCKRVVMVVDGRLFFPDETGGCPGGGCPCGWPRDHGRTRG